MKKFTFILLALISGTAFAQETDVATANINAEIVMPISIKNDRGLNFGRLIGAAGSATIAATAEGARTGDNHVLAATGTGSTAPSSGAFTIKAASGYTYSIQVDAPTNLKIGTDGATLPITFTHSLAEASNQGAGSTGIPLYLGGTVNVSVNQAEGNYAGQVDVTVSYE